MAPICVPQAASSSSSAPRQVYDVFLSFYGEDTGKNFTDHLYAVLKRKGIISFRDDEKLERGKYISQELLNAIQESQFAIVIISKKYAFSKWCMIELTKILESRTKTGLIVLPVFYYVDPSYVRKQKGNFEQAFAKHGEDPEVNEEKMKAWKVALNDVGHLAGWHIYDSHESVVIEEISRKILLELKYSSSNRPDGLIGIGCKIERVISLLFLGLDDVRFVGICGMAGIGKTTLAKAIYDQLSSQFEASCFIAHVREEARNHGVVQLQTQIICEILKESGLRIWNAYAGIDVIARKVRNRNVFIVLDDVDSENQLKALAGSHSWFGQGSRVILTSRDRHLLKRYVDNIYEVMELSEDESLELFSWKAFKNDHPEENYMEFSKDIVGYAQGLPLAIEIFGSYLFGRTIDAWKAAREQLKANLKGDILDKLKISYDGLEDSQKRLFLYIACLFNGKYNPREDERKLKCLSHYLDIDIDVLGDRCLLKYFKGQLVMHDLVQKMGQQIIYQEFANEPGRRSILWHPEDIVHVLNNNTGTVAVEGINLGLVFLTKEVLMGSMEGVSHIISGVPSPTMELSLEGFSKMKNLKILVSGDCQSSGKFHTFHWYGDFSNFTLSSELRYLHWVGYPLESLPKNFEPKNLIGLEVPHSYIKQWDGKKRFDKLKYIDMSFSNNLMETSDFSGVPNLEELDLQYCTSLSKIHSSLGFLKRLKKLDLEGCRRLNNLPKEINLEFLTYLNLAGCSRITKFPDIVGNMKSLKLLDLVGTGIKELPLSFKNLSSIENLNLCGCLRYRSIDYQRNGNNTNLIQGHFVESLEKKYLHISSYRWCNFGVLDIEGTTSSPSSLLLSNLFSGFNSLKRLDLSFLNLSNEDIPIDFSCLSSIEFLNLSGNKLTTIPISVSQLPNLSQLHLRYCSKLQALPEPLFSHFSILEELNLGYCNLLDGTIPKCLGCSSSLKFLSLAGNKFRKVPDLVQLSSLTNLYLEDCTQLEALPKLPLSLEQLGLENCESLEISRVERAGALINECTFLAIHVDNDGRPYKVLHQSSSSQSDLLLNEKNLGPRIIVGSALISKIPDWFNLRITSSFRTMESCFQWRGLGAWNGCALLIIYQVHEPHTFHGERKKQKLDEKRTSNCKIFDGNNHALPHFLCHFQDNELGTKASLLLCAPEVPSARPKAFWVYISSNWFYKHVGGNDLDVSTKGYIVASIESCNLNVEVECGARGIYWDDHSTLAEVASNISSQGLNVETCEELFAQSFHVFGPIKGVKSGSSASTSNKLRSGMAITTYGTTRR